MKFLVVGCGSIGQRHIRNLIELGISRDDIYVCDRDESRLRAEVVDKLDVKNYYTDYENIKDKFDAVLITLPNSLHLRVYRKLKNNAEYFFIEKPISHDLYDIKELLDNKDRIMVGYNLRFEKGINIVKKLLKENIIGKVYSARIQFGQYLPDWHPNRDYSKEYSANRSMGGGVILDVTHEIDYALMLFGQPEEIIAMYDTVSNLKIDTEDLAEIIIKFKSSLFCTIHLDYLQRQYSRQCQLIGENGSLFLDLKNKEIKIINKDVDKDEIIRYDQEPNYTYLEELKYFINGVREKNKIETNAEVGIDSLKVAILAKESSEKGIRIKF